MSQSNKHSIELGVIVVSRLKLKIEIDDVIFFEHLKIILAARVRALKSYF